MRLPWVSRRRHEAKIAWWQQLENAALTERNEALKENRRLRDELDRLRETVALHRPVNRGLVCERCCSAWPCSTVRAAGLNGEEDA